MNHHLIISPHLDDAWFSLGGSINQWRKTGHAVTVVDVFSIQSWTTGKDLPATQVTRIRKLEECENAARDGVTLEFLDLPEGQLRGYELVFPEEIDWTIDGATLASVVATLQTTDCLQADRVYFPLGVGGHVDHLLLREAFNLLSDSLLGRGVEIGFYEDLPYASYDELPVNFISRHRLVPILQKIDLDHKITAVKTYKSQIDANVVASIKDHSYALGGRREAHERLWMSRHPRDPYPIEVL